MRLIYLIAFVAIMSCKTQDKVIVNETLPIQSNSHKVFEIVDADLAGSSEFKGVIYDENGEAMPFANVYYQDSTLKNGTQSDFDGNFKIKIETPGVYSFTVHNVGFTDYVIKDFVIEKNKIYNLKIYLTEGDQIQLLKPVVYLYPEKETEVGVKVEPNGEFLFTYPVYNDSWKVTAFPNGKLKDSSNQYDYLFWDANINWKPNNEFRENGSYVKKEDLIPFFEQKLKEIGLNSSEMNDFITFWGPKLSDNDKTYIHLVLNDDCNELSKLNVSPKPDNVLRLFMVYQDVSELKTLVPVKEQKFISYKRIGFTVVEWGGGEINLKIDQFEN